MKHISEIIEEMGLNEKYHNHPKNFHGLPVHEMREGEDRCKYCGKKIHHEDRTSISTHS